MTIQRGKKMKNSNNINESTKKKISTNYPPDPHSVFCKRCYKFNKGCPNTQSKHKDEECFL